nr:PREDICTED: piggyBac transposable element-derived protein 4-like [Lepisosteus oculatus]
MACKDEKEQESGDIPEIVVEIGENDTNTESDDDDGLSGLDSADSVSEAAYEDGLDPLLDFEDIEETPTAFPSRCAAVRPRKRRRRYILASPHSSLSSPVGRRGARAHTSSASDPEDRWKSAKEEDVEPEQFPFCPERTPGPQLDTTKTYSPLDLFQLFFSLSVVQSLCTNTNKNAERLQAQGRKLQWVPVSVEDMYRYMGIVIYMGLLMAHNIRDYWSPRVPYNLPVCRSVMSRTKFEDISWTLHISDPEEDKKNYRKRGTPQHDRLFCLRPLLDSLIQACQTYYHPHQSITIDERIRPSKAGIAFKQYVNQKPSRWSLKLFVLADAASGYTCNFSIYTGKSHSASGKGLSYDSVMELIKGSQLGTGYHLYVDSFYTSTALFRDLHVLKIGACGMMRDNREGFPRTTENRMPKKAKRGTLRWLRNGNLLFTKWMDKREVTMCSSIHKAYKGEIAHRRVRNQAGSLKMKMLPVPTPVRAYSQHTGGVSLSDSRVNFCSRLQKTRKWYKKVFFHFIDMVVVNSYLLHKDLAKIQSFQAYSHKVFREELCRQLVSIGAEEAMASTKKQGLCVPIALMDGKIVNPSSKSSVGRKYCVLCTEEKTRNKTPWKCESCDVALCLIVDRNCFRKWHERLQNKDGPGAC